MRLRKLGEELALSPRHCFISVSVHGNLGQFLFSCVVISEVQLPGGKALATRPPEEQAGELSTFCKQAISVAQGTVLLCTAKNVGSLLCSVKFREEKVLSHTPPSLCSSAAFQSPSPVSCRNTEDDDKIFYYVLL